MANISLLPCAPLAVALSMVSRKQTVIEISGDDPFVLFLHFMITRAYFCLFPNCAYD